LPLLLQLHTTSSDIKKSNERLSYYNDIKNLPFNLKISFSSMCFKHKKMSQKK